MFMPCLLLFGIGIVVYLIIGFSKSKEREKFKTGIKEIESPNDFFTVLIGVVILLALIFFVLFSLFAQMAQ
jgi:Na+/H+ antiporter NhaC